MLTGPKQIPVGKGRSAPSWPPLSLVRILWNAKGRLLLTWAVLSGGVLAVVARWPATYKAETLILVDQQKIPEKFVSATVNTELQDRLATISQEILSSTRLQKIIDTYKLYEHERKDSSQEEIVDLMRADIKVTAEKGWVQNRPGAFRVSYQGRDPNVVAQVANELGSLFIEENLRNRETIAEGTSDFMKTQLTEAKQALEEQEKKLSEFKQAYNGELPEQESALTQELAQLQTELQGSQDAMSRASQNKMTLETALSVAQSTEATLKRLTEASNDQVRRNPGSASVGGSPAKKKSELLEQQLADLTVKYAPGYPDVQNLKLLIAKTKAEEAAGEAKAEADAREAARKKEEAAASEAAGASVKSPAAKETRPLNVEAVRALAAQQERDALLASQLAAIDSDLKLKQAEQQKILSRVQEVQARLRRLPLREQELSKVTRDYEASKANYNSLQDKIFAADMSTEMERRQKSERFTVLDPAQVPEKPAKPNRPVIDGIGCAGALAVSLGFWIFSGIRKNKFLGEWELPDGVLILGRVPPLPAGGRTA